MSDSDPIIVIDRETGETFEGAILGEDPSDRNGVHNGDGATHIKEYVNSLVAPAGAPGAARTLRGEQMPPPSPDQLLRHRLRLSNVPGTLDFTSRTSRP